MNLGAYQVQPQQLQQYMITSMSRERIIRLGSTWCIIKWRIQYQPDIMFSFPVVVNGGSYNIKDDVNIHQSLSESLKVTEEELIKEREIIKKYLP